MNTKIGRFIVNPLTVVVLWSPLCSCACGSSGSEKESEIVDAAGDVAEVVDVVAPPPSWKEIIGVQLEGVKRLAGFACNGSQVFFDVEGTERGLYWWDTASGEMPKKIHDGVGPIALTGKSVLVADYQGTGRSTSVVLVDPKEGVGVDQGFSFPSLEVKVMQVEGSNLYTLSRDETTAQYLVHQGKVGGGTFAPVGPPFDVTTMGMYVTSDSIMVLTLLQDVAGTVCKTTPLDSVGPAVWTDCPGFPDYVAEKDGEAYSANAMLYGAGNRFAAWFRVTDKGVTGVRHHVASDKIKWTEVVGLPDVEPNAWFHDEEEIILGYMGPGVTAAVWAAPADGSGNGFPLGEHMPMPGDKTGVAGICRSGDRIVLAWLDYAPMGSTLSFKRLVYPK